MMHSSSNNNKRRVLFDIREPTREERYLHILTIPTNNLASNVVIDLMLRRGIFVESRVKNHLERA
jgi:hypothetical protein